MTGIDRYAPPDTDDDLHVAPTSQGWKNRVAVRSASSSRIYIVGQRTSDDSWGCSCPAWKIRRTCKHLAAMDLPSAPPKALSNRPVKVRTADSNFTFTDAAYAHYDISQGFGSADEWIRIAEKIAAGRGRYTRPPRSRATGIHATDLALLLLDTVPALPKDLVSAMRARATVLHPDHGGDPEAFKAMFAAYERLVRLYPSK